MENNEKMFSLFTVLAFLLGGLRESQQKETLEKDFLYKIKDEVSLYYICDINGNSLSPKTSSHLLSHQFMFVREEEKEYYCQLCSNPHKTTVVIFSVDDRKYYRAMPDDLERIS